QASPYQVACPPLTWPATAYSPAVHGNAPLSSDGGQDAPCQGAASCAYDSPAWLSVSCDPVVVVAAGDGEAVAADDARAAADVGATAGAWSATWVEDEPPSVVAMITMAATATAVPA